MTNEGDTTAGMVIEALVQRGAVVAQANANGEWGWLTDVVEVPIAGALADLLLGVTS
ncbi:MAG: hypothetical protein ACRDTD_03350 [Pseudonocardiaceae bacterium]